MQSTELCLLTRPASGNSYGVLKLLGTCTKYCLISKKAGLVHFISHQGIEHDDSELATVFVTTAQLIENYI